MKFLLALTCHWSSYYCPLVAYHFLSFGAWGRYYSIHCMGYFQACYGLMKEVT